MYCLRILSTCQLSFNFLKDGHNGAVRKENGRAYAIFIQLYDFLFSPSETA